MCSPHEVEDLINQYEARNMTIHCNHCKQISSGSQKAETLNGRPGVCPRCFSEDWRTSSEVFAEIEAAAMAELRRATLIREFVTGWVR